MDENTLIAASTGRERTYLDSEGSRFLDRSPDADTGAWDSQETHTGPRPPAKLRLAPKHNTGKDVNEER